MRRNVSTSRTLAAVSVGVVIALISTLPVSATPKDQNGSHKVTICHVTNSASNPYVVIDIDVAAFDGEGKNDHTQHFSKDGRIDVPSVDGECHADRGADPASPPPGDDGPPIVGDDQ